MKRYFLAISLLSSLSIYAQTNYCGTTLSDEQKTWLKNFQQNYHPESGTRSEETVYYVPVKAHLVGTDAGTGYLSFGTLLTDICTLNDQYAPVGFYFYLSGVDYINNTDYYVHDYSSGTDMMDGYSVDNYLNLFFVDDPAGNCGYYSPWGDAVALAISCSQPNNSTVPHEIGHFFSLPHTFNGWEDGTPPLSDQDRVDGLNCNSTGDGFCDTSPDYLAYRWPCPGPEQTDPTGTNFYSDATLFMSYAYDECENRFSDEQIDAMHANITGPRHTMLTFTTPAYLDLGEATLVEPLNDASGLFANYTVCKWDAVAYATGYDLQISYNPSFTALAYEKYATDTVEIVTTLAPEKTYYWRVKPFSEMNTCEGYTTAFKFSTGAEMASAIEENNSAFSFFAINPNPVHASQQLHIELNTSVPMDAAIQIMDMQGRRVFVSPYHIVNGYQHIDLSIPELAEGLYVLQLGDHKNAEVKKFMVIK